MLIPSINIRISNYKASLSRRVNANSQRFSPILRRRLKLIKKGEC